MWGTSFPSASFQTCFFQVKWVSRNFSRETIGEWWSGKFFLQTHPPRSGSGGHGARQQDHPDPRRGFFHGKRRVTSPDLFWETAMSNMRTLACGNMWKHVGKLLGAQHPHLLSYFCSSIVQNQVPIFMKRVYSKHVWTNDWRYCIHILSHSPGHWLCTVKSQ